MRKYLFVFLFALFLPAFTFAEVSSVDNGYAEKINSYGVNATLNDNASIDVTENITYDFGDNQKHGIYRYIPTVYTGRRGNPRQSIQIKSVTDDKGTNQPFELSNTNDNEVIKIGDADALITGVRVYEIKYSLSHMVSTDSDGDRFRWDAIGTGWEVPMKNVIVTLKSSDKALGNLKTTKCYTGASGSTEICDFQTEGNALRMALLSLYPHVGVTLDSLYKSGTFPAPNKLEIWLWESHWYYWLPLIAFILFLGLWWEKGRDPKGRGTIVPMYDPPKGIIPYTASILLEERVSRKSLPAEIIALAIQGYIKIHQKETKVLFITNKDYELELLKPLPLTAPEIDRSLVAALFGGTTTVNLSTLDSGFATENMKLHTLAYKEMTDKGYFVVSPIISRIIFYAGSGALAVFGLLLAIYFLVGFVGFVSFLAPGAIGLLFAFIMPVKTKAGAIMKEDLLGLKMYIQVAEIDRIKFHNAPAKSPEKFEELLPYAIVFGLEKQWAEEFKDVYKTTPDWYDGNFSTFSIIALTSDLGNFSDAAIASVVSNTSSGMGGGFSGGGGGGGGGGSW